jgi:hypothetical protein
MMRCLETDLDTVFSARHFGEDDDVKYQGVGQTIPGIFDNEDIEEQLGEGGVVLVPQAMFTCALSKVPDLKKDDYLTIRGRKWTIMFWKRDGAGVVEIFLEKREC